MAKRIRDIIDRELIVHTQPTRYRQEYGVVGTTGNVAHVLGKTHLRTTRQIDKIVFVTINGVTQVLGVDYLRIDDFTIQFMGIVLNTKTIIIGYHYFKNNSEMLKVGPMLTKFFITPDGGKDNLIKFYFDIEKNGGYNIFWSLHRDGKEEVIKNPNGEELSGTALSVDGNDGSKAVEYEITPDDYIANAGREINFTIIVVYDFTTDGSELDEKLVGSASYLVDGVAESVLSLDITPDGAITQPVVDKEFDVTYNILQGSYVSLQWRLEDPDGKVIDSGDETNLPNDKHVTPKPTFSFDHTSSSKTYKLYINETGTEKSVSDTISVHIKPPVQDAIAGWWANSRRAEITDATTFYNLTQNNGTHDYFTGDPYKDPGANNETPSKDLLEDPVVVSEEPLMGFKGAFVILKIPTAWGGFNVRLGSDLYPESAFDVYDGVPGDGVTEGFKWLIYKTMFTFGTAQISIKRL